MEVVFKILHFLYLSSVCTGLRLGPSINIQGPLDLQLGIGGYQLNDVDSNTNELLAHNNCFCLPHSADTLPVITHLSQTSEHLERMVVYLYRSDRVVTVYIPNKNKQSLMPELHFDENEGDIIKSATSESILNLFDLKSNFKPQHTVEIANVSETIDQETAKPLLINTNTDSHKQLIENNDFSPVVPSEDNNTLDNDKPFEEQNELIENISIPQSPVHDDAIINPALKEIINLGDTDQLPSINSIFPSQSQATESQIIAASQNIIDTIPNLDAFDPLNQIAPVLPSKSPDTTGSLGKIIKPTLDTTQISGDSHQLLSIISMLPQDSQSLNNEPIETNNHEFNIAPNFDNSDQLLPSISVSLSNSPHPSTNPGNVNKPDRDSIQNVDKPNQVDQSALQPISSQTVPPNDHVLDTIPDFDNSDQLHHAMLPLPSKSLQSSNGQEEVNNPSLDNIQNMILPDQSVQTLPISPSKPKPYKVELNNINYLDTNELRKLFLLFPSKSHSYFQTPLHQTPHLTFYNWFEDQLRHVVIYHLETPVKTIELRERIKKVLYDNGMQLTSTGIVIDSHGSLVRMNNIKLRPVLIYSTHFNHLGFQNHQINTAGTAVSYVQLIEIIKIKPPSLLGTLVMGTVQLPRNVDKSPKVNKWYINKHENSDSINRPLCVKCTESNDQDHQFLPYPLVSRLIHPLPVPYGQYYGLPFRRYSEPQKQVSANLPSTEQTSAVPQRRMNNNVNSGFGGVFEGLLGNFGISPNLFVNPSRRLLGGRLPNSPKPGPRVYSNNVLPGFRIVGGNAATSSGTPLVSKGRSGYENAIING